MKEIAIWVEPYKKLWETRFDAIETLLDEMQSDKKVIKNKFNKRKT